MNKLIDKVYESISDYLDSTGWTQSNIFNDEQLGYRIDPLTGLIHRPDFAFLIQSERDILKLYEK